MPLGQPKKGRPWIRHGLGFLFLALLFLALIVYQIYNDHSVATVHAQANVENLSMTLESKLEQALLEAQWEVNAVAANIDVEAMQPANAVRYRPQISRWLKSQTGPGPGALALRVFDANGGYLYSSNDNEPAFNIADRKYFRQLQADPSIHALFSDVLSGRVSGQPTVFAARAVRDRNGAFLGIALNGIELADLHKYFSVLELGTEGMVAVRRLDNGALVVRYPGTIEINNKPVMDLPSRLALLKDGRPETVNNRSPVDGIHRIYSYRKIGDFPFFVVVGASATDYLAGWRQNAVISLLTSLLFLASLAAVYLRLVRAEARRRKSMDLLQTSEERFRLMFDRASDGILIMSPSGDLFSVNEAFARMHGYTSEEMLVMNLKDIDTPECARLVPERVQRILAGEPLTFEAEHYHKDGHVVQLEISSSLIAIEGLSVIQAFHRDISERKRAEHQIQTLAFSDPLTGLPNRRLLLDRLEQALAAGSRHGHQDALLFVDLDNFKSINDTLGHSKGDTLLKQISQRLTACVREGDTVARLGGDEFVVLLGDLSSSSQEAATQALVVAEKILVALGQPYDIEGHGHHSSASIGVTLFGGAQRERVEDPMKRAELAMYQAKAAGRNTLRIFEPEMGTAAKNRATLEAELREAVNKGQFLLYFQAQGQDNVSLSGVEALVRWQHPERGLVSPAEFIPIAESSNLILPLGRWVLEAACKQLTAWATRPEMSRLTMAVNVSARQFRQPDFVEEVLTILNANGTKPESLKLELTESVLVDNVEDIIVKMNALKARGVGFSLDDFGTGYSSLSYLKRLPLDLLKIDKSFVTDILTDPDDAAIARMVVALADSLGLNVIAEGVETEAQRDFLANLGCRNYQGYLLSRPLPIEEFEVFAVKVAQSLKG